MYQSNDRLINLVVGAVVVIVFLLIGRLKRPLRRPPSETYRCGRCRRMFRHDARTVKAWRNGFRKFYCSEVTGRDTKYGARSCFLTSGKDSASPQTENLRIGGGFCFDWLGWLDSNQRPID